MWGEMQLDNARQAGKRFTRYEFQSLTTVIIISLFIHSKQWHRAKSSYAAKMNGRKKSNSFFSNEKYRLWKCPLLLIALFILLNVCLCFSSEQENVASLTTHKRSPSPDLQAALRDENGSISDEKNKVAEDLGEKPLEKVRARRGLLGLPHSQGLKRRSPTPDVRRLHRLHNFAAALTNTVALFLGSLPTEARKQRAFERFTACVYQQLSPRVDPAVFLERPRKCLTNLVDSYHVDSPSAGAGTTMPLVADITRIIEAEGEVSFQMKRVLNKLYLDSVALFPRWPSTSQKITIPFTEEDKIEFATMMGLLRGSRRTALSPAREEPNELTKNIRTSTVPRQYFLESPNANRPDNQQNTGSINRQNGVRRSQTVQVESVRRFESLEGGSVRRQSSLDSSIRNIRNGRRNAVAMDDPDGFALSQKLQTMDGTQPSESSTGNRRQDRRNAVVMDDPEGFHPSQTLQMPSDQQPSESSTGSRLQNRRNAVVMDDPEGFHLSQSLQMSSDQQLRLQNRRNAVAMDDPDGFELSQRLQTMNGTQPSESSTGIRRNARRNGLALDHESGKRLAAGLEALRNPRRMPPPRSATENLFDRSSGSSRTVRRNRRTPSRSPSSASQRSSWLQFEDPQNLINAQIPRQNEGSMFDKYADVFRYALITDLPEPTKKVVNSSSSSHNQFDGNRALNNNFNGNDSGSTTAASNKSNEPSVTVDHHTKKSSKRHRSSRHKRREKRRLKRAMKAALENSANL